LGLLFIEHYRGNQIKGDETDGTYTAHGGYEEYIYIYIFVVENLRPPRTLRHRWESSIKMNFKETYESGVDWIRIGEGREQWWTLVSKLIDLGFHKKSGIS
jgi:hypothetical protein